MASERSGKGIVLKINTGTVGAATWTQIASQTNASVTFSGDTIDVSSKESFSRAFVAGHHQYTVSMDAAYVKSGADYAKLLAAFEGTTDALKKIQIMWVEDATNYRWAYGYITSMPHEFPMGEAATISLEIQITGDWTTV